MGKVEHVRMEALACAVPTQSITLLDRASDFGESTVRKISLGTGISSYRKATDEQCASDFCFAAASKLLDQNPKLRSEIDSLIFVTQTPDYRLPATACILQERLQLSTHCAAFDINLGCSGYVYGLWMASGLIAAGLSRKVLLLVGDTITKTVAQNDRSVSLLFGDAGSATILGQSPDPGDAFIFDVGTDGAGFDNIIVKSGGFRKPSEETRVEADSYLKMNGPGVFEFTQTRIADSLVKLMATSGTSRDNLDFFVPHQANAMLLERLSAKLNIKRESLVVGLAEFGNTSSVTIPLALVTHCGEALRDRARKRFLLSGFGVGLSWASTICDLGGVLVPPLVEV